MKCSLILSVIASFLLLFQNTQSQTWSQLIPATSAAPLPRQNAIGVYDAIGNRMVIFGGKTAEGDTNDVWAFDFSTQIWTDITPADSNIPQQRFGHTGIYDPQTRRMIIWSGQQSGVGFFNDIWAFDLVTEHWQELTPDSGSPNKRYGSASVYDPANHRIVMFAGFTDMGRFDDTQAFDLTNNTWMNLTPSGIKPEIRCLHTASYDSINHRMIIFGGQHSTFLNDIWAFDLTANTWTDLTPATNPEARIFSSSVYSNGTFILFGGGSTTASLNDTWAFDLTKNSWSEITTSMPRAYYRSKHTAIHIPQEDAMVIFGGSDILTYNDVWKLTGLTTRVDDEPPIPEKTTLYQNYPNPFNPGTSIKYTLAQAQGVTLTVYDILGREVRTLVDEVQSAGEHTVSFEGANLPSGVYVCQLKSRSGVQSRTMMLLK